MTRAGANTTSGLRAASLRKEHARHLRGRGQFVSDVQLPHTQDVAFVRSPHAHARIRGIVVAPNAGGRIFTARDLPRLAEMRAVPQVAGFKVSGYPPLATQKVRYVGEAIAVCVAPTRAQAEDLAKTVRVDFEVLPAVIDAAAAGTGAPSLGHEDWANNPFIERRVQDGDIDAVARAADVVVHRNYRMHRHVAVPLEGRAVLAYRDHRLDELVVYTSTQVPHIIRLGLSEVLGLEERRIRVRGKEDRSDDRQVRCLGLRPRCARRGCSRGRPGARCGPARVLPGQAGAVLYDGEPRRRLRCQYARADPASGE